MTETNLPVTCLIQQARKNVSRGRTDVYQYSVLGAALPDKAPKRVAVNLVDGSGIQWHGQRELRNSYDDLEQIRLEAILRGGAPPVATSPSTPPRLSDGAQSRAPRARIQPFGVG